jgi:hypothetical protein
MSLSVVHGRFVPMFVAITFCTTSRFLLFVHLSLFAVQSCLFLMFQENEKQVLLADPGASYLIHCKDILMSSMPKRDELMERILGYSHYHLILRMVTGIQLINGFWQG